MLGVVTLYNPEPNETASNIRRYIHDLDALIIWDNSPLEAGIKQQILADLGEDAGKVVWHGDGQNHCIAPAVNYAWHYGQEHGYDLLLIMDQDSQWQHFANYRAQIENYLANENMGVFTPFFPEHDTWMPDGPIHFRRTFINSGTVIPLKILNAIGGADEALPLDALDTDLSYRILKKGYQCICLTECLLHHSIGKPQKKGFLHLFTNNYGRFRTYSITRGHIICYRKHHDVMTAYEKRVFFKEIFMWKFIRMVLVEDDKIGRFKSFLKGIRDGISYRL